MKKIDKLVLDAFLGPFLITFLVVVFILLNINMLKYFDDIIGKGLDSIVLGQLFFYFAVFTVPTAMPLAVLISSLIAFGNLGEHFELTAIKSAGISLVRILRPIFYFVIILTVVAFYANNNLVPKAALEAYSLLYDIKQKKPALELREGTFYRGIDNLSIKVNKKFPDDEEALKGVIVYDHRKNDGNKEVTIADSGRMYTIMNERYLKFELFNGYNYIEGAGNQQGITGKRVGNSQSLSRSKFTKTQVVFDLSSFQLQTTDKKWFQGNRIMRNLRELTEDMDSLDAEVLDQRLNYYLTKPTYFTFYATGDSLVLPQEIYAYKLVRDSINRLPHVANEILKKTILPADKSLTVADSLKPKVGLTQNEANGSPINVDTVRKKVSPGDSTKPHRLITKKTAFTIRKEKGEGKIPEKKVMLMDSGSVVGRAIAQARLDSSRTAKIDSIFMRSPTRDQLQGATNAARQIKSQVQNSIGSIDTYQKEFLVFEVQWHKILASSFACITMFLIGAPLGAIIKKGGLGVPFLVSIFFFIVYYVITMQGEKLAKRGSLDVVAGVWMADFILLVIGLVFLRQARVDARFFEADFYSVVMDKVKRWLMSRGYLKAKSG
ncbi:MAG: LptF/LptG family permease [Cyclobacteriaceae bacterium]|nr:LptF/LptG family permease [Cyclobacteriaceae bacterium]MDH5250477.1 LptF/LptG family permease [Cyclobacteriaceae bacterium]